MEGDTTIRVVSAYAPQTDRQDFFRDVLRPRINSRTVLGIDANCVMDVALDVRSHAQRQPNHGGRELAQAVAEAGLVDVMRERLEMERRFTSHHLGGGSLSSRWKDIGTAAPARGKEIQNPALAEALQQRTEFDAADRDRLGIGRDENGKEKVRYGQYIKRATNYYKPTGGKRVAKRI